MYQNNLIGVLINHRYIFDGTIMCEIKLNNSL